MFIREFYFLPNARPLWNNAILGPLFLTSGLTTASAVILYFTRMEKERKLFSKILLGLIVIQLFLFVHMMMGYYSSSEAALYAVDLLFGEDFKFLFFGVVLFLGLILPAILEFLDLLGYKVNVAIPVILVVIGGIVFRFVMVDAGQISHFIY